MLNEKQNVNFFKKINKTESCWIWKGALLHNGYGLFRVGKKNFRAHRVSYEFHFNEAPRDLMVCHRCDVPACVNPDHLFLGTGSDNQKDSIRKNRHKETRKTHCKYGHEFNKENTYRYPNGWRRCIKCRDIHYEKYYDVYWGKSKLSKE